MNTAAPSHPGASPTPETEPLANFTRELKQRVLGDLRARHLSLIDQRGMILKAVITYGSWLLSYALYLYLAHTFGWHAFWALLPLYFSMLCIVLAVMHDASHGTFSPSKRLNRLAFGSMLFAGATMTFWRRGHVQYHHGHTNVDGIDRDFESGGLLRLHPAQSRHRHHRFQHLYAWFLYSMHTLKWIWWDDYHEYLTDVFKLTAAAKKAVVKEIAICKSWHILSFLVVPLIVTKGSVGLVLAFYVAHWLLMGISLTIVFLMAHLTGVQQTCASREEEQPDWALHQLATTADFATGNRALTWVIGGLNFQIEHHIFPNISSTRYPLIRPLVKAYCRERGVAYHEYPTFRAVLYDHYRHLKQLGTPSTVG